MRSHSVEEDRDIRIEPALSLELGHLLDKLVPKLAGVLLGLYQDLCRVHIELLAQVPLLPGLMVSGQPQTQGRCAPPQLDLGVGKESLVARYDPSREECLG